MAEHQHETEQHQSGTMDISEQKKTYGRFINLLIIHIIIIPLILIFLAIVGT